MAVVCSSCHRNLQMKKPWPDKPRNSRTAKLPFAYKVSPDDIMVIIPDPELVKWVEEALDLLDNGHSTSKVAERLTNEA